MGLACAKEIERLPVKRFIFGQNHADGLKTRSGFKYMMAAVFV